MDEDGINAFFIAQISCKPAGLFHSLHSFKNFLADYEKHLEIRLIAGFTFVP